MRVLYALGVGTVLAMVGCGGDVDVAPVSGELQLALRSVGSDGATYRLRDAVFDLDGAADLTVMGESALPDSESLLVGVPSGWTRVTLEEGWYLETERAGAWVSVDAWLASENPVWVEVGPGATSYLSFSFQLDSGEYVGPSGTLDIDFDVNGADPSICAPGETHQLAGPTPYDNQGPYCGYGGRLYAANGTYLEGPGSQFCACVPEDACMFWYRGGRFAEPLESESHVACNENGELYWDGVAPYRDADWCVCLEPSTEPVDCPAGSAYRLADNAPFDPDRYACGYQGSIIDLTIAEGYCYVVNRTSPYCECVAESECNFEYTHKRFAPELDASLHTGCTENGELYWDGVPPFRDTEYCVCR